MADRSGRLAGDKGMGEVLWEGLANRRVAKVWAIGGSLTVDLEGISFRPNGVERVLRSRAVRISASDVESFRLRPGLLYNIVIALKSGGTEKFKVNEPSAMVAALHKLQLG